MKESKSAELSRRRLFAGAGAVGALAAAAVAVPLVRPSEAVVAAAKPAPDKGGGYQVTQHVLDYYQTARV
ncbi:MAG: ubiquinol-cytochrome c reductase iron-sulfur subunit N-terminal domain-containing protein [Pseudomonadota bacterium]